MHCRVRNKAGTPVNIMHLLALRQWSAEQVSAATQTYQAV